MEIAVGEREVEKRQSAVLDLAYQEPLAATATGLATFISLRYRNFRLLWLSTLFMSAGQWVQQVTLGWLAYQLTGSAFTLGVINGFRSLPMIVIGPLGGVAAD